MMGFLPLNWPRLHICRPSYVSLTIYHSNLCLQLFGFGAATLNDKNLMESWFVSML